MQMPPRWLTAGCRGAAILAAITCTAPCNVAYAQGRLEAEYTASLAGLTIGEGVWVVSIGEKEYTAEVSGRVTGLLSLISSGDGSVSARGTVSQGGLSATHYASDVKYVVTGKSKKFSTVRMELGSRTVKNLALEPSNPPDKKEVPVTEAHQREIIDPLTALLIPIAGAGEVLTAGACEQTLPVFNGAHRFNLVLAFKRMEEVRADKGYRGAAVVCGVNYQPVAGYNPHAHTVKYLVKNRDMEIWLTPIAGTRVLAPFRIAVPTKIGLAVLQAKRFVAVALEPRR